MTIVGWIQIAIFSGVIFLLTKPLGIYMARVLEEDKLVLAPVERLCYQLSGVNADKQMSWIEYARALLVFSCVSAIFTYAILRLQGFLPLNPMGFSTRSAPPYATVMTPDLAFNTAVSFTTNTNWQAYSGESTLSYFSQMVGLAFHNFASAAIGISVAIVLIRGFTRKPQEIQEIQETPELLTRVLPTQRGQAQELQTGVGNFWRDLIRSTLYILLPLSIFIAVVLMGQGVIQNLEPYVVATTLEGLKQIIPMGPVASQEAIKLLGTNGGGFFNANSAHPFENPTPLSNFIEMLAIFAIPAGLTYTFGAMVKDTRQGWTLLLTMYLFFLVGTTICYYFEAQGNPNFNKLGIETSASKLYDLGGNMEGKEIRFGIANSALFATVTTDTSCGAVNCTHDSLTPLGGLIPLLNIQLGELIFGGVGTGLAGMLIYAIITVFIAGLMVGRTPEYLGKKIEQKEIKMAMLYVLISAALILILTAIACVLKLPVGSWWNSLGATYNNTNNAGPHGLSELLYAFSSTSGNNGSAFAGLSANTPFYNLVLGLAMLIGRFWLIIPVLAIAGSLVVKKQVAKSSGTFPTHGTIFIVLLSGVILIVGALTYLPVLTLGPIVEHLLMIKGVLF